MTTAPLICLKDVGVYRSNRWLIRHICMDLAAAEIVTIIGPNGAGKSTLAKSLLGLIAPTEGEVQRPKDLRVGYVPQKLNVGHSLPITVKRFLTLTNRLSAAEIQDGLETVGIPHLAEAALGTLSGGEFQRMLLARALLRRPDLLVLDEPVQGVDYLGEIALYDIIGAIRDQLGCAILLISHDLHIVMRRTDRVLCLNGHICCQGSPQSVRESPEYQTLFGPLSDRLALYQHHHTHQH